MAQEGRELEVHINLIPRNERLAVLVLDEQATDGRRKHKRIDFDFLNRNFAVELPGQLFDSNGADDRRQNEETQDRVEEQQTKDPKQQFTSAWRN